MNKEGAAMKEAVPSLFAGSWIARDYPGSYFSEWKMNAVLT
ncbi:hypothetical protein [Arachidicoccus terrestris]|nr:hypothetical protein [Arachidicoccus terrestris]